MSAEALETGFVEARDTGVFARAGVLRVPKMTRLRMSRPVLSVPNQCSAPGGCITLVRSVK